MIRRSKALMPFYVVCGNCGHSNRPAKSLDESIKITLLGEFRKCRSCDSEFRTIKIPNRSRVTEIIDVIGESNIHSMIKIIACDNRDLQAMGVTSVNPD